eukprot:365725-Chlamydomonas_euryale.AAC.11
MQADQASNPSPAFAPSSIACIALPAYMNAPDSHVYAAAAPPSGPRDSSNRSPSNVQPGRWPPVTFALLTMKSRPLPPPSGEACLPGVRAPVPHDGPGRSSSPLSPALLLPLSSRTKTSSKFSDSALPPSPTPTPSSVCMSPSPPTAAAAAAAAAAVVGGGGCGARTRRIRGRLPDRPSKGTGV